MIFRKKKSEKTTDLFHVHPPGRVCHGIELHKGKTPRRTYVSGWEKSEKKHSCKLLHLELPFKLDLIICSTSSLQSSVSDSFFGVQRPVRVTFLYQITTLLYWNYYKRAPVSRFLINRISFTMIPHLNTSCRI